MNKYIIKIKLRLLPDFMNDLGDLGGKLRTYLTYRAVLAINVHVALFKFIART